MENRKCNIRNAAVTHQLHAMSGKNEQNKEKKPIQKSDVIADLLSGNVCTYVEWSNNAIAVIDRNFFQLFRLFSLTVVERGRETDIVYTNR